MCRSAASDAIRKLAASVQKLCVEGDCVCTVTDGENTHHCVVHDAEDLTSGFRPLIGVPERKNGTETTIWRSLMGRYFEYNKTGRGGSTIEAVLLAAVGPLGSKARIELESAMTAVPARDMPTGRGLGHTEAFVEEAVSSWDGTPGGVACAGIGTDDDPIMDVMCYGRKSYVPDRDSDEKPPHLRVGRPYRFALQAVFAGGRTVPTNPFSGLFPAERPDLEGDDDVRARLFYPSRGLVSKGGATSLPYIRALRHQRIGAPTLLIPEGHARRRNGPMGFESAGKMIVRTMRNFGEKTHGSRESSRSTPAISQRVLVVPHQPLALVSRHFEESRNEERKSFGVSGVLDRFDNTGAPPGGLSSVYYEKGRQGFPTARTSFKAGINGEAYIDTRKIVRNARSEDTSVGEEEESASSVFWHRPENNTVDTDYYPDPAADTLVLRARRVAGQSGKRALLAGDPVQVKLVSDGQIYPNQLPVLLTLKRDRSRNEAEECLQSSVIIDSGAQTFDAGLPGDLRRGSRQSCASVDLYLAPGDQFDIEMWIVPSPTRLAHDFAAVQALIQVICNLGDPESGNCDLASLRNGIPLFTAFPSEICKDLLNALRHLTEDTSGLRYVGPGGDILPGSEAIKAFGAALHRMMLTHPLPEIAATRTVAAIHAVNVPAKGKKPVASALTNGVDHFPDDDCPLPNEALPNVDLEPMRAIRPKTLERDVTTFTDKAAIAAASKAFALTGEVEIDLEKMDALEIVARSVSPDKTVFDDPKRGRSLAHRQAGTWPNEIGADDVPRPRKAGDVFGFQVARDGRVKLREGDVTLMRIDALPFADENGGSNKIDLKPYFLNIDEGKNRLTSRRHPFPDGKARRLSISINGLARTAEYMTTVSRVAKTGDPWLQGSGLVFERNELVPSERLSPEWQRNLSTPREVILPATIRPTIVEAKAPLPVFEHTEDVISFHADGTSLSYTRHACVRLRLQRGWFSSGVDEKLGIVLWPPNQLLADAPNLNLNRVALRDRDDCEDMSDSTIPNDDRLVALTDFSDEDLGAGGAFVTRRGTDPVRMPDYASEMKETQIFLSQSAFPDLWRHPDDPALATFVPHVLMPLADTDVSDYDDANAEIDIVPPMAISLVTYEPRFDIKEEEWFVNLLLTPGRSADGFVRFGLVRYQPHTRAELRCSRPTVQWAQPLPERNVLLHLSANKSVLTVEMMGPTSKGRAPEPGAKDPMSGAPSPFENEVNERNAPRMRLRAFSESSTPSGGMAREEVVLNSDNVVALTGDLAKLFPVKNDRDENSAIEVNVDIKNAEGVWRAEIMLGDLNVDLSELKIKLEEVEYFLPSDLGEDEPISPEALRNFDAKQWREHGKRFSKVISVRDLLQTENVIPEPPK